ncbi:MAG: hypothetical protein JNJ57_01125 [Saprospiraceae bacterium]|nr:hypothetical protein [Saprospiraceae bacterium]
MIKNTLIAILVIFLLGNLCRLGMPWWGIVPIAAATGWLFATSGFQAFLSGFVAGSALWGIQAYLADTANHSELSSKIGQLFQGVSSAKLLLATTLMGGLLSAFGALTGRWLKDLFSKPKQQDYYRRRRRGGKYR